MAGNGDSHTLCSLLNTTVLNAHLAAGLLLSPRFYSDWLEALRYCEFRSYGQSYRCLMEEALKGGYLHKLKVTSVLRGSFEEAVLNLKNNVEDDDV